MTGDGRLTPDDLDRVLGDPTGAASRGPDAAAAKPELRVSDHRQEPARTDEIAAGPDRPTWGARFADAVRHHKRLTAGIATCVLVLAALTGYVRTRPPPLDTRITATAWFWPNPNTSGAQITGGVARSLVHLQLPPGAPALRVVGYTGAGLGPAVVTQQGAEVRVTNPVDCTTIGSFATPVVPPVLHVERTDQWGRTVSGDVPLSDNPGTTPVAASSVGDSLRQACVGLLADSLQLSGLRAVVAPVTGKSRLVLPLGNPTGTDLLVVAAQAAFQPPDATIGWANAQGSDPQVGVMVPAGRTTSVDLAVTRADCRADTSWESTDGAMSEDGRRSGNFMLAVRPSPGPPNGTYGNVTAVQLTAAQRAAVIAALVAPCRAPS